MEKFISRINEIELLTKEINADRKSLIPIVGRRGSGKTRLLKEFENIINREEFLVLNWSGKLNATKKQQIKFATQLLKDINENFDRNNVVFDEWFDFFSVLKDQIELFYKLDKKRRKIIFLIDEFSWLHNNRSAFVDCFADFFQNLNLNISFIITSSSVSWMNKNVLITRGGLHSKCTNMIFLYPFTLLETVNYICKNISKNLSVFEMVQYYLFTGGVPRYLAKIKGEYSIQQNMDIIFETGNNKQDNELRELFNNIFENKNNNHLDVIKIFKNHNRLTAKEITNILNKKYHNKITYKTVLSTLSDLEVSGLVKSIKEFKKEKKDKIYILSDLFCYFYLKFIQNKKESYSSLNIINGFAFEILCYLNLGIKNDYEFFLKENSFSNKYEITGSSWKNNEAQIDFIVDLGKYSYVMIENKFLKDKLILNEKTCKNLINKMNAFEEHVKKQFRIKKIENIKPLFFTFCGVDNRSHQLLKFQEINLEEEIEKYLKYYF